MPSTARPEPCGAAWLTRAVQKNLGTGVRKSSGQVIPEVLDVLAAHAQAQEAGRQVLLAGHLRAALDRAFHATQAGGRPYHADRVADGVVCGRIGTSSLSSGVWRPC